MAQASGHGQCHLPSGANTAGPCARCGDLLMKTGLVGGEEVLLRLSIVP